MRIATAESGRGGVALDRTCESSMHVYRAMRRGERLGAKRRLTDVATSDGEYEADVEVEAGMVQLQ